MAETKDAPKDAKPAEAKPGDKKEGASAPAAAQPAAAGTPATPSATDAKPDAKKDEHGAEAEAAPKGPSKISLILAKLKAMFARKKKEPAAAVASLPKGPGFFVQIKELVMDLILLPVTILRGDWITKLLFLGFIVGLGLLVFTGKQLWEKYIPKKIPAQAHMEEDEVPEEIPENWEEKADNFVYLNRFKAPMKSKNGDVTQVQVELYLECADAASAKMVKSRLIEFQDLFAESIENQEYETLITEKGKEELHVKLTAAAQKRLEKHLPKGKVVGVHVSSLLMD